LKRTCCLNAVLAGLRDLTFGASASSPLEDMLLDALLVYRVSSLGTW
jgi:hypothetical protein